MKVCGFLLVKFGVVDLRIVLSIEISMPLILISIVSSKVVQSDSFLTSIRALKRQFSADLDSDPTANFFVVLIRIFFSKFPYHVKSFVDQLHFS